MFRPSDPKTPALDVLGSPTARSPANDLEIHTSTDGTDAEWDAFLAAQDAHHAQTSLWARVKDSVGWRAARFIMRTPTGEIVGGCQVFFRRLPAIGSVAYIPRGPILADGDGRGIDDLLDRIRTAQRASLRYLLVEPSDLVAPVARSLKASGFEPATVNIGPRATLVLRVDPDEDQLLRSMKPRTRYNIRLATRREIEVREGSGDDLRTFYDLLQATSRRQGFRVYPEAYYRRIWDVLGAGGNARLFVASYRGEPVSAQLAVAFGSTVTNKLTVWSGEHPDRKPNEAVHWAAIRWAGSAGFRFYDFEGIDVSVARALVAGSDVASNTMPSVTAFKLGFGGEIRIAPQAYERIVGRLLRVLYRNTVRPVTRHVAFRKTVSGLRTRGGPILSP